MNYLAAGSISLQETIALQTRFYTLHTRPRTCPGVVAMVKHFATLPNSARRWQSTREVLNH